MSEKGIIEKLGITPGPWKGLHGGGIDRRGNKHIYAAEPYGQICVLDKRVCDANDSALIAAAPEMLEALIEMSDMFITDSIPTRMSVLQKSEKAIQKATGKSWEEIKALL